MSTYAITPPPSVNNLYPTIRGRRVKSSQYRAWLSEAGWQLKAQQAKPIRGPVEISIIVPDNNRRDLDGYLKPTLDLLVSHGIIEGDKCKTVRHIYMQWSGDPAMLVTIFADGGGSWHYTESPRPATASRRSGRSSGS
jgi:Holliday junction resolvase RusA-like endonuclease